MNRRLIIVLVFALAISASASFLLYRLVSARVAAGAATPSSQLVVAAHTLSPGTRIKDADLKVVDWPGERPKVAITERAEILDRGVVQPILEGEPFVDSRLAAKGVGGGLASSIPDGMRAVAVKVNDVAGVAGFAVPGMRVDVLVTGNPSMGGSQPAGPNTTVARTLLQDIEVLSAGQVFQKDAEGKPVTAQVVNLLVTPQQAETLSLASNEAKVQLVLRNPVDRKEARTTGVMLQSLFSEGVPATRPRSVPVSAPKRREVAVAKAAEAPFTIEIISGTRRVQTSVPGVPK